MKVTGSQTQAISDLTAQKTKVKGAPAGRPENTPEQEPSSVSNSASQTLNRIKETIGKQPDIRSERVAELKAKVESGALKVDSEKLAGKMLTDSIAEDLERP